MIFIEDQQADAFQCRVCLQAAGENALGHHFDTGRGANLAVQPDPVTDGLPDLLAQLTGQPLGRRASRQSTWFEHQNGLVAQPRLVEQCQWHAGCLAGAGWRFEHGFVAQAQGFTQGWQYGIDR
ncbi:hypothetical protein D3C80_942780 [compost metagenome]